MLGALLVVWIVAFVSQGGFAEVIIWSPKQLVTDQHVQLQTGDGACFVTSFVHRRQISDCLPAALPEGLYLSETAESLTCVVVLSSQDHRNLPYLIGSYAASGTPNLYDVVESAQTRIEITDDFIKPDTLLADSGFTVIRVDKNNVQDLDLPSASTIVQVNVQDLTPQDIHHIIDVVNVKFSGNYLGVLSQPSPRSELWTVLQDVEDVGKRKASPSDFLSWEILVGLVISLMLIGILAFFLDLLSKIETPLRFQRRPFDILLKQNGMLPRGIRRSWVPFEIIKAW